MMDLGFLGGGYGGVARFIVPATGQAEKGERECGCEK